MTWLGGENSTVVVRGSLGGQLLLTSTEGGCRACRVYHCELGSEETI